jgi:hypothetical protein
VKQLTLAKKPTRRLQLHEKPTVAYALFAGCAAELVENSNFPNWKEWLTSGLDRTAALQRRE